MSDEHDRPHEHESDETQPLHFINPSKKPSLSARLILPWSKRYRITVTSHCLLRALSSRVIPVDADETEFSDQLLAQYPHLSKSPGISRTFNISTFFSLYQVHFNRIAPLLFLKLRKDIFHIDEERYQSQWQDPLHSVDGLGFSGSLFFFSDDESAVVKSVGRQFEYTFLYEKMIDGYAFYVSSMTQVGNRTLLCQILDVLGCFEYRLGSWLGISPQHYLVMTNVLEGLDKERGCRKWDLKPQNFFEPTRDLIPDPVKTEAAKSGLADELDEEIVLSRKQKDALMAVLRRDTQFLAEMQTIDYSLLLGRYPVDMFHDDQGETRTESENDGFRLPEMDGEDWTRGVRSADGKWVYRMCLLDFLWNVEQLRPKIMQAAGKLLPEQTVTTEPERYRDEFMKMMDNYIVVPGEEHDESSGETSGDGEFVQV